LQTAAFLCMSISRRLTAIFSCALCVKPRSWSKILKRSALLMALTACVSARWISLVRLVFRMVRGNDSSCCLFNLSAFSICLKDWLLCLVACILRINRQLRCEGTSSDRQNYRDSTSPWQIRRVLDRRPGDSGCSGQKGLRLAQHRRRCRLHDRVHQRHVQGHPLQTLMQAIRRHSCVHCAYCSLKETFCYERLPTTFIVPSEQCTSHRLNRVAF
jgi:hypothetical protein